jgi:DNA-binding NtrC family response regulator
MSVQTSSPQAPTVLIADDESIVLRAISMTLINVGYRVLQGRDGHEARAVLEEHRGQPLDLLITDIDMPGGGGQELAKFAMERFADLKVIYTSGKPPRALSVPLERSSNSKFLEKPFATQDLMKSVRALLTN